MASVYRKTATKPLPPNAEIVTRKGEQFARWKNRRGKNRTAPTTTGRDGSDRIVVQAGTYTAKYRDGQGIVREVATGCRDETAARQVLADLQRRAELVKAKVITASEDATANHQASLFEEHIVAHADYQRAKDLNLVSIRNTESRLRQVAADCRFCRLGDLNATALGKWLASQKSAGMGAGTRNEYRAACVAFGNWCVATNRLVSNPFDGAPKADARADCRRKRRALTESELRLLLDAARRRPLQDAMTIRRGKNKGKLLAKVDDLRRHKLELLGQERALVYKTYLLTGLRKGELGSLEVGQLELDGPLPVACLDVGDEKNREGNEIALRSDLVADLRDWLAGKLQAIQADARRRGEPIPARLPADTLIFYVPTGLLRILNRDLVSAGIPKRDERGRTIDLHALRHTFGTHLSKGGVAPRTAQAAMRHSSVDLTMNVYTDPKLLDVHGALDALPQMPLDGKHDERERATGTAGASVKLPRKFAPESAPNSDKARVSRASGDKREGVVHHSGDEEPLVVSRDIDKRKHLSSIADNGCIEVERKRLELSTSAMRTQRSPN